MTFKVAVTGTHSTGKSTFLGALNARLTERGRKVGRVCNLAVRARELGFPILDGHTIDSTLWIMAEGLRQEAELSLTCDIILVDRPILDALGYLHAALEMSGRAVDAERFARLHKIAGAHTSDYGLLLMTVPDPAIPLGEGRDTNEAFRQVAARHIAELVAKFTPSAWLLTPASAEALLDQAEALVMGDRSS
jgi:predicted ATPase